MSDSFVIMDCNPPGSCPWDSPGNSTGVGCHFLLQGDFPDSGIKPMCLTSPGLAGGFFTTSATWEAHNKAQDYFGISKDNFIQTGTFQTEHTEKLGSSY